MNLLSGLCFVLPVGLVALAGTVPTSTTAPAAPFERIHFTGRITAWHVAADGTVGLKLQDSDEVGVESLWFHTPANQTDATLFEDLILETAIEMVTSNREISIVYERDKEISGKTLDDSFPIAAIFSGAPMAEIVTAEQRK